jgi:hypothetical protein
MVDVGVGSSLTKKQRLEVQRQRAKGCGSEDVLVNEWWWNDGDGEREVVGWGCKKEKQETL